MSLERASRASQWFGVLDFYLQKVRGQDSRKLKSLVRLRLQRMGNQRGRVLGQVLKLTLISLGH